MGFTVDPTLYTGAPEPPLSAAEARLYARLERLGIPFFRAEHDAAATIESCHTVEKTLGAPIVKNLFLCNAQRTRFYLLLLTGDKPFKTKYLSAQIGSSRLSFAEPCHMERLLGVLPGAATVLSLLNDTDGSVKLLIDREVLLLPEIGCHPLVNTRTLRLRTADILSRFLPDCGHTPTAVDLPNPNEEQGGTKA